MRLSLRLVPAALTAVAVLALTAASAFADSGTFSGSFTATTCGPLHAIQVATGETTIDVVATADVPSNDIVLNLHHPAGTVIASADSGTSPEEINYSRADLEPGTYYAQVCPFLTPIIPFVAPLSYTGTFATRSGPAAGLPVDDTGGAGGTQGPRYVGGKLLFSPATVIDPQRTEGEPLNYIDARTGTYWESGPWGTSTQNSFIHRSDDDGLSFHIVSPLGIRSDSPPGGGDTDLVSDDQGNVYFTDLELVNLGNSVSNDGGMTWRKNPAAIENVGVDRQWYAFDNGTTSSTSDNTGFVGVREVGVGIKIYSTPGSKGLTDPVGGLVFQEASAAAPLPVGADASCGQMRFDPRTRNLYYPCLAGNRIRVTIGHVEPGQRTGIVFRNVLAPQSPGGGSIGDIFPALATDRAGNVYVAWIDQSDHNVYYSASSNQGATWTTPIRVNAGASVTNVFVWAHGGESGSLALAWLGTSAVGAPNSFPQWSAAPGPATAVKWLGYVAAITKAAGKTPTIAQQPFTSKPMHYGQICTGGIGCTGRGDRTMADFFAVSLDRQGALRFVYNDTTSQHHGAHLFEVRQLQGKVLDGGTVSRALPVNPVSDTTGDAQWPHYAPTGAGPNVPQLDLVGAALGSPAAGTLRVRMTLASLASLAPPQGKTSATWLTRFLSLSTANGAEAYRIFYVGAESAAGGAPSFFAGSTLCVDSTPGTCKIVIYPKLTAAAVPGKVCGNSIVIDAPLTAFGAPVGNTLYAVTALTFGRNGDADSYADVDATGSFDYALGQTTTTASC
jgi:hypothetical protein